MLPDADVSTILVRPCPDPRFGDYQCNSLMPLAKGRKMNPRQLAQEVLDRLARPTGRRCTRATPARCSAACRPPSEPAYGYFRPLAWLTMNCSRCATGKTPSR